MNEGSKRNVSSALLVCLALIGGFDLRGSTVAIANSGGAVTDRIEYSAYGLMTYRSGTNNTPFLYNGSFGVMSEPNGLLCMGERYYNPHVCRFINADPSGFSGGLNFFAFANGNPITRVDPSGLGAIEAANGGSWINWIWSGLGFNNSLTAQQNREEGAIQAVNFYSLGLADDIGATFFGRNLHDEQVQGFQLGLAAVNVAAFLLPIVRVESAALRVGEEAANIALGSRFSGLRTFAAEIGADHLLDVPNNKWKDVFLSHVDNTSTKFHVNMRGFFGDTPSDMILNEMQSGSNTGWELQQLQQAGRLHQVNFYQPGQLTPISNPFVK
jgi:RHS repeat-associated protein